MISRPLLIRGALVCFGLLIGGISAEAGLRLYVAAAGGWFARALDDWDPFAVLVEPHGELGYRQKPNSTYHYGNGRAATSNAMGFRGPTVARERSPGTYRIALLGGSATHGWGVRDDETIDASMRELLHERYPDRAFDVVNLAFDGYDAYQVFERLDTEWHWLNADAVIVNSGVNDVRNARFLDLKYPDPRTVLWQPAITRLAKERQRGSPTLWTQMKHYSYLARVPGILRAQASNRPSASSAGVQSEIRPNFQAIGHFERSLWRIADLLGPGTAVIFSTPPSSLRTRYRENDASTRSYWLEDAATTQQVRDSLAARMRRVVERLRSQGRAATYLRPTLPASMFLDDAHLTARGNRSVAQLFVDALAPDIATNRHGDSSTTPSSQDPETRDSKR